MDLTNILFYGINETVNNYAFNYVLEKLNIKNKRQLKEHTLNHVKYKSTNEFFIFDSDGSNEQLSAIQKLIENKSIITTRHYILIYNIERLKDLFYQYRILFEKYHKSVLFFATTINLCIIEGSIKSRFYLYRVRCVIDRITTPIKTIKNFKKINIKFLCNKLIKYEIRDIVLDILDILEEKEKIRFLEKASEIENLYILSGNKKKENYISLLLIEGLFETNILLKECFTQLRINNDT